MLDRRVTVFVGHFGSGKTEIALNSAFALRQDGQPVTVVDLDVVKPYFRTRAARNLLAERGIRLLAPTGDSVFADLPILVPEVRNLLRSPVERLVLDVGGDETGARPLGSLSDVLPREETRVWVVLNFRRPFTRDAAEAELMVRQIEAAGRVSVDGLVSNTHLMGETTPEIVLEGYDLAEETAARTGVPVVGVTVERDLLGGAQPDELTWTQALKCPLTLLERIVRPPFDPRLAGRKTGPLFVLN